MKLASIGEGMLELRVGDDGSCDLSYGGDTLNTAVYLARLGLSVDYATALGDDVHSDRLLEAWRDEGVGIGLIPRLPGRLPGLYMIRTDARGERSFDYWRESAPARELFELPEAASLAGLLSGYDWLYLSGITLAIYRESGRAALLDLLDRARSRGCRIAFDGNYRPRLWPSHDAARIALGRILPRADLVLSSLDDERMLHGGSDPGVHARRLRAAGVAEVVIKQEAQGCLVATAAGETTVPAEDGVVPVDTTAAGDSFNAAYLAARLQGIGPVAAARWGHRLAAAVIRYPGAIIPRAAMPSFEGLPSEACPRNP